MVFKKYIKRGGKLYGPYLYENKRVGSRVITTYVGRDEAEGKSVLNTGEKNNFKFLLLGIGILVIVLLAVLVHNGMITGKVSENGESSDASAGTSAPADSGSSEGSSEGQIAQESGAAPEAGTEQQPPSDETADASSNAEASDGAESPVEAENPPAPASETGEVSEEMPIVVRNETETITNETAGEIISNETEGVINETISNEAIANETILNETILNETIINETILNITSNLNFFKDIETIRLGINESAEIDLSEHFAGAERYEFVASNIIGTFDENILTLSVEEGFKGARKGKVIAFALVEGVEQSVESNEFNILVSSGAIRIDTSHDNIKVGERVKWTANVSLENAGENVTIELPKEAEDISVKKVDESGENIEVQTSIITGEVVYSGEGKGVLSVLWNKITAFFGSMTRFTGFAVEEGATAEDNGAKEVVLQDNATNYVIEYYTDAPVATESETDYGKQVVISGPDNLNYTDVLSYTNISEVLSVGQEDAIRIYWVENNSYVDFDAYDLDGNNFIDYVEWITPHLSNQTFEIILITKAEHLDDNRTFVEDVYESVKSLDGNWTTIPAGDYLRVTFEQSLDSTRDITIYARSNVSGNETNASIIVYRENSNSSVAVFDSITSEGYYKILLTNLSEGESYSTFDLLSVGGVEYDYVVDPVGVNAKNMLAYRGGADNTIPVYKTHNSTGFSAAGSALDPGTGVLRDVRVVSSKSSSSDEKILCIHDDNADVKCQIWNGSVWSGLTTFSLNSGTSPPVGFGLDYINTTDAIVCYLNIAGTSNQTLPYCSIWSGSAWRYVNGSSTPGGSNLDLIKIFSDPSSNYVAVGTHDAADDINYQFFDGSTFGNLKEVETSGSSNSNAFTFDGIWLKDGRFMAVWFDNAGDRLRAQFFNKTSGWESTVYDAITELGSSLVQEPLAVARVGANEALILVASGTNNYLIANFWNGSAFGTNQTLSTGIGAVSTGGGNFLFGLNYEQSGDNQGITVYGNGSRTGGRYRTWNGSTWSSEVLLSSSIQAATWIQLASEPSTENIMLTTLIDTNVSTREWNGSAFETSRTVHDTASNDAGWAAWFVYGYNVSVAVAGLQVSIAYPQNTTYNTKPTALNYTVSDAPQACWWSNNTGLTNNTITCGNNVTGLGTNVSEGTNKLTVYANDTSNNINSSSVTFFVDSIVPLISVTYPSSGANFTYANVGVNYTASDANLRACWWTNSSGLVNTTITCGNNITGNWNQGANTVRVYANDSAGNANSSVVTFGIDSAAPLISVTYPTNGANFSYANVGVNYTASDANLQACWWTNSSGLVNTTITCGTNITGNWNQGANTVRVYANDSYNNVNSSSVVFFVDSINPLISVAYPPSGANFTYANIGVNYTASDANLQACWWTNSSGLVNTTITCGTNITGNWNQGANTVRVYANDSYNNVNSSSVAFFVDSINPQINLTYPLNATYNINVSKLNYTVSDFSLESCWYSTNQGINNFSVTCGSNVTGLTSVEGSNKWIVWANDSFGNINYSSVTFFKDTIVPIITVYSPQNTSYNNRTILVNFTDDNYQALWFNNGTANISYTTSVYANSNEGSNTFVFYANDSAGNLNYTSVIFFVDSVKPLISFVSPTPENNSLLSQNSIPVNVSVIEANLDKIVLRLYNSSELINTTISSSSSLFINFTNLADGIYYINASANDTLGNENLTSTRKITLDTTKPGVAITYPQNTSYGETQNELNYSVSDIHLQACWYSIDSGANNSITCGQNVSSLTSIEGSNTWRVYANDSAGNLNYSSVTFSVDLSAPGVYFVLPTEGPGVYLNRKNINVNVTASNLELSNLTIYLFNATALVNSSVTNESGASTNFYANFSNLNDGVYHFNATAVDTFGRSNSTGTRTVTVDTIKPLINLVSPTDTSGISVNRNNILINASAYDINLQSITINIYNSSSGLVYSASSPNSSLFVNQSGLADGLYYFNATALDLAGNSNYTETKNITLETQAPLITINSPQNITYTTQIILFNVTLSENGACLYSLDSSANITMGSSNNREFVNVNSSMTEGGHSAVFYCNDSVGNLNSTSVVFGVDTIVPVITVYSPQNTSYNNRTIWVNFTADSYQALWFNNGTANISYTTPVYANSNEGSNTFVFYANDSAGNQNSSSIVFNVDSFNPQINLKYPLNASYNYKPTELNYTVSDANLQACWWSNNTGLTNNTITCGNNVTGIVADEGSNKWIVYANDTSNNIDSSTVVFFVDSIVPLVSVTYPANGANFSYANVGVNYTVSDANLRACWWTNSSGLVNTTITCGNNITGNWNQGANTVRVYANDSAGNANSSVVIFGVDSAAPVINATYPLNTTYNIKPTELNYTVSDANLQACWWSNNSGLANNTITCGNNVTGMNATEGTNKWTVYANDTLGNKNSSTVVFFVDSIVPNLLITYPQNASYAVNVTALNYTVGDSNLQSCWYSLNFGQTNSTVTCGNNATGLSSAQGSNTWRVYANDSAGNTNSSSVTFFKDTIAPTITVNRPENKTYALNSMIFNVTLNESGSCAYSLNNGIANITMSSVDNRNFNATNSSIADGSYNAAFYCNDTIGNAANKSVVFAINSFVPEIDIKYPINNSYLNYNMSVNVTYTIISSALSNCWYLVDGGASSALTCGNNFTLNLTEANHLVEIFANSTSGIEGTDSSNFTIDLTYPRVALVSPPSGFEYSSNSQRVVLQYNVTEINIKNCSLIVNGSVANDSVSAGYSVDASAGAINEFVNYFVPGVYLWNVSCADLVNNANSSTTRNFSVTAPIVAPVVPPAAGGGGGGGGGVAVVTPKAEVPISIEPKDLTASIVIGRNETRKMLITNNGNSTIALTISAGSLSDILKIDSSVTLGAGEQKTLEVSLADFAKGIRTGIITFSGGGYSKEVSVTINVKSENFLFDVSINTPDSNKIVKPGQTITSYVSLAQVGPKEKVDVFATYVMKDFSGNVYLEESETFYVLGTKDYTKEFVIPSDLLPGKYIVGLELTYPGAFGTSSFQFEVAPAVKSSYAVIVGVIIALAVVASFIILGRRGFLIRKQNKKV